MQPEQTPTLRQALEASDSSWGSRLARTVLAAGAIAAFVVGWDWCASMRSRGIARLPRGERSQLLERTMANVRTLCLPVHDGRLDSFCTDQADLLAEIPECDQACVALADTLRPRATR